MNNSCFLVPTHIHKFDFAAKLIKSYNNFYDDDHIYIIFSNVSESEIFKEIDDTLKYRSLIYSGAVTDGIITRKKFEGLIDIFEKTDFTIVAVIDCDTEFIKKVDYDTMFKNYLQKGKIYANISHHASSISSSPFKFFKNEDLEKIKKIVRDGSLYFWFNEIPLYEREHFCNFIEYIEFEKGLHQVSWHDFDYIIYAYYMLVKDKFKLEIVKINDNELTCDVAFQENGNDIKREDWIKILEQTNPMWITKLIEEEHMKNVFMKLHTDRKNMS